MNHTQKYFARKSRYHRLMDKLDWRPTMLDRTLVKHFMDLSRAPINAIRNEMIRQYFEDTTGPGRALIRKETHHDL